jgi:hypothetical protein
VGLDVPGHCKTKASPRALQVGRGAAPQAELLAINDPQKMHELFKLMRLDNNSFMIYSRIEQFFLSFDRLPAVCSSD